MKDILFNAIFIISLSIIIALISGIYSFNKLNTPLRVMFWYTCVSTVMGGCISIMSMKAINNIFWVNTFTLIEFGIIMTAYYKAFKFRKKIFIWIYLVLLILAFVIYLIPTLTDARVYNNTLNAGVPMILVIISIEYLIINFYKGELEGNNRPFILLSVGVFMYFASSFLIVFIGSDNSLLSETEVLWIYLIHSIFYLIFVITLTIAFAICRKESAHLN